MQVGNRLLSNVLIGFGIGVVCFLVELNYYPIYHALLEGFFISILTIAICQLNKRWLFPKFYFSNHIRSFFIYNIIISIVLAGIHAALGVFFLSYYHSFEHAVEVSPGIQLTRSLVLMSLGNLAGMVLLFSNSLKKQAVPDMQPKENKLGAAITLLKAQINPHFIFNALNNIYSLAYTKSENVTDSVLKLSEMLRYIFDDCQQDRIKLLSEINYIERYISFQKMKTEHEQKILFKLGAISGDELISPMLLIPLIENSFKYCDIEDDSEAWVEINLEKVAGGISFMIKNSIPKSGRPGSHSRMGITNVHSRLDLLYPESHQLAINEDNHSFSIHLKLDL